MCLAQNPEQFAMYPLRVYRRILNNSLCTPYVFVTESSTIRYVPLCVYHRILNNSLCIPYVFITGS